MYTTAMKSFHLLITVLFTILLNLSSCTLDDEVKFGIYLVQNGELVLSDRHIEKYRWDTHTIELNDEGILQWNSFITYKDIPKLADTLFKKDFTMKVHDKEVYSGKFYSMLSSSSYDGVIILDAITKLDRKRNTVEIDYGYGPEINSPDDPRNNLDLYDCLKEANLLE